MISKAFEKCKFPTECVFNPKTQGGGEAGGKSVILVKKQKEVQNDLILQQLKDYIDSALIRVSNS